MQRSRLPFLRRCHAQGIPDLAHRNADRRQLALCARERRQRSDLFERRAGVPAVGALHPGDAAHQHRAASERRRAIAERLDQFGPPATLPSSFNPATGRLTVGSRRNYDPLLDALANSRGRIGVGISAEQPALVMPAWPEIARVIEDCRA